jgi:hypothetical protein
LRLNESVCRVEAVEGQMALSRFTVSQIIQIVAQDPESLHRANSWLGKIPTDTGTAGVVRNFSMVLGSIATLGQSKAFDPSERDQIAYQYSCDGIAEATSKAIRRRLPTVAHLVSVDAQARERGYSHTGTLIMMDDKTKYVLDWWKTLNVRDPFVFQYRNFMQDLGGGIPFSSFNGFA